MIRSILTLLLFIFLQGICHAQKVGLVLSGGGVRGFAHIGVIKALEEKGVPIDYITGTSAGALVGSMYAQGYSPAEMEQLVLSNRFRDWATGSLEEDYSYYFKKKEPDAGWVQIKFSLDSVIKTHLPNSIINSAAVDFALMENTSPAIAKAGYDFDNLFVPFRCVAADIVTKSQIVFNCGDLGQAVRSSMAYPLYFNPVTVSNRILFDGGIYNNFPYDIMLRDFNPEVMIGVSASGSPDIPYEDNIFSQVKNLIVQTTNYTLPGEKDVMIVPDNERIGLFDFTAVKQAIDSGYTAAMRMMDKIKSSVPEKRDAKEVAEKRKKYRENDPPYFIDKIIVDGVTEEQAFYVRKILNPMEKPIPVEELRRNYYKLIADDNIRHVFPKLVFNTVSGYYDLYVTVRCENDLRVDFGGIVSSRPINEGFLSLQYNFWGRQSLSIQANTYFGKLYNSTAIKLRLDVPGRLMFSVEPYLIYNRFDFFSSSTSFFEDIKPPYLIQSDRSFGMNASIPARNKGKITGTFALLNLSNEYYQTRSFSQTDTADQTELNGYAVSFQFERNTLNRKMYASKGTYLNLTARYVEADENTQPGTTSADRTSTLNFRHWWQLKMNYDNYFKSFGALHLGFYSELSFSVQPFFSNYTATILSAPDFQPTPENKTLFLDNFRAFNYTGAGMKGVFDLPGNIDLRLEGYIFQPFQEIKQNPVTLKAFYGNAFSRRYYVASLGAVYHSPVGPVSFSVNYYDDRDKPYTFLFHIGYILFNRRALE